MLSIHVDRTSEIEDSHEFNEILSATSIDELNITYSPMNEQHDLLEELLGVSLARADGASGSTGMAPCGVRCGDTRVGVDSCRLPHLGICLSPPFIFH